LKKYDKLNIRVKKPSKHTHLYVLAAGGLHKIGVTNNIDKRIKTLQTGNPNIITLEYLDERKNPHKAEKYLHQIFQSNRVHGEWFEGLSVDVIRRKLLLFLDQD
jgi:hypothetical protein